MVEIESCVVFDTRANRNAAGEFAGNRVGGQTTTYQIAGIFPAGQGGGNTTCDVPSSAEAIELNFVAINAVNEGNLRVSATGTTPSGGILNFGALAPKMNNANAAIIPLSATGQIDVYMNGGPHNLNNPIAETRGTITGYYAPANT